MILQRSAASTAKELAEAKAKAAQEINVKSGKSRLYFITEIPGQSMIYSAKEVEAKQYLVEDPDGTSTTIDTTGYPFIHNEIGVTADTAYAVAQVFLNLAQQWRYVGSQLEQMRVGYNAQISTATTTAQVRQSVEDFTLAMQAFLNAVGVSD